MVNASILSNFTNVTSFSTLGQQVNQTTEGYFGLSLVIMFWVVVFFAMWNKAERAVALMSASFLTIFWALMIVVLGWMDSSVIIITVVVFLISVAIAFFQG